jgi:hypothetical protein
MSIRFVIVTCILLMLVTSLFSTADCAEESQPKSRYYIAVRATLSTSKIIRVFGATNLPSGSVLTVHIYDFLGTGSHIYNQETVAAVGDNGIFRVEAKAKNDNSFKRNMLCEVVFMPTDHRQPQGVISEVGKGGERLGTAFENPQVGCTNRVRCLQDLTVVQ